MKPYHVSMGPYYRRTSSYLCREADKRKRLADLSDIAAEDRQVENLELDLFTKIDEQLRSSAGPWSSFTSGGSHRQDDVVYYDDIPRQQEEESPSLWLAKILLLDGCYLFVNFVDRDQVMKTTTTTTRTSSSQRGGGGGGASSSSTTATRRRRAAAPHSGPVVRDTWYLLQNQIPFFVLEEIYVRVTGRTAVEARMAFTSYARTLLWNLKMYNTRLALASNNMEVAPPPDNVFHLLHLLHTLLKPLDPPAAHINTDNTTTTSTKLSHLVHLLLTTLFKPRRNNPPAAADGISDVDVGPWHRATEYRTYGNVVFESQKINGGGGTNTSTGRRRPVEVLRVLDVGFNGRNKLMVPRLHLDGHTCTLLRNLMALERQHPRLGTHITAYCAFISQMASTKHDVDLLVSRGVIEHHLGSPEDVAATLAELGSSVVLDMNDGGMNYLKRLWHNLEERYTSRAQNVMAWLCQNYFSWRNISVLVGVVAALILLVAGVLSAVYQILAYKHPAPPCEGH